MGKKVIRINSDGKGSRVVVGPGVSKRKGKDWGTQQGRKSSQDKPNRRRPW